jgi:hypothetical protein
MAKAPQEQGPSGRRTPPVADRGTSWPMLARSWQCGSPAGSVRRERPSMAQKGPQESPTIAAHCDPVAQHPTGSRAGRGVSWPGEQGRPVDRSGIPARSPGLPIVGAVHDAVGRHQHRHRRERGRGAEVRGWLLRPVRGRDRMQPPQRVLRVPRRGLHRNGVGSALLPQPPRHDHGDVDDRSRGYERLERRPLPARGVTGHRIRTASPRKPSLKAPPGRTVEAPRSLPA